MIASRRWWAAAGTVTAVCLTVTPARAVEPNAAAMAQVLFDEGLTLMEQGLFAEACPKLAESQRLDPGGGTALNLASCLERLGRLASAYASYGEALSAAIRDGRKEREAIAKERLAALGPLMSRVELRVVPASRDAAISLDGTRLGPSGWTTPLPVDPGPHEVVATAPGRRPFRVTFDVPVNGRRVTVDVPALDGEAATPAATMDPAPAPTRPEGTPRRDARWTQRNTATVALVGGAVLTAAGGVLGGLALARKSASDDGCPTATTCTPEGAAAMDSARTLAWSSNVTLGLGVVAAATGLVLWLTAPAAFARTGRLGVLGGVF